MSVIREIPLCLILLDNSMIKWVEKNADDQCKIINPKRLPKSKYNCVGILKDSRIASLEKTTSHPAVEISKYKNTSYYSVIDGRHRIVLAIKNKKLSIKCKINQIVHH